VNLRQCRLLDPAARGVQDRGTEGARVRNPHADPRPASTVARILAASGRRAALPSAPCKLKETVFAAKCCHARGFGQVADMSNAHANAAAAAPPAGMRRLELELALDAATAGRRLTGQALREAADSAGADLLFALPGPRGEGVTAALRLRQDGVPALVQVVSTEAGYLLVAEGDMDPGLLGLAQASADVLERMSADSAIRTHLAAR
jgi:hypothetical protein